VRDFAPITMVSRGVTVLVVHPSIPVSNVQGAHRLRQSKKGNLSYASAGPGTASHLTGELFKQVHGTEDSGMCPIKAPVSH
jgi:tripartite-type tricarboxylate transporter receptor subunit TctC